MAIYLVLCQNSVFLSFLKMYIALKPCEWVLEAVIVFVVLDMRAPRLKARPLRYPVGCGLENGRWRKPEMSRILRQFLIRPMLRRHGAPGQKLVVDMISKHPCQAGVGRYWAAIRFLLHIEISRS